MKNIYTLLILMLPSLAISQSYISGRVVDENQNPIPYSSVLLVDPIDGQNFEGTSADEEGLFKVETYREGKVKVKVLSIGFEEYNTGEIILKNEGDTIDLSDIKLVEEAFALNDVSVVAEQIPIKKEIDRTVISLENTPSAKGSSILDILEKTPGVILDRQNNSISMLGKDGVNVMINGKMTYMPTTALVQYLNGLAADGVKSIELITTPPAKYDAEGNSGYINIVLKKKLDEGYNASFAATNSYSYNDDKSQRNISGNFTASNAKQNLNVNYSFLRNQIPWEGNFKRIYTNAFPNIETSTVFFNGGMDVPTHNIKFSYEYYLTEKLEIGTSVSGFSSVENQNGTTDYSGGNDTAYMFDRDELKEWKSAQINFFSVYKFSEKTKIEASYDILKYQNFTNYEANFSTTEYNLPDNLYTEKESPFEINVSKLDFETELFSKVNYTAGLKYVKSNFENYNNVEIDQAPLAEFVNNSFLDETLLAAYSQVKFDVTDNIKVQAGMRYEYTDTFVDSFDGEVFVDREYGNFFPSLFLGYKINDFNNLNLSYSKRITRPAFTDMAPYLVFLDLNTAVFGNVKLVPSYSKNYQLDYRYKTISLSAQYSDETDVYEKFTPAINEETNFITFSPNNLDSRKTLTAILSFPLNPIKDWSIRYFTSLSYAQAQGELNGLFIDNSMTSVRFNMNNNIRLTDSWRVEVSGFYQSKTNLNNGGFMLPMGKLDLSLQKKVNDNLSLTLNGFNMLNTLQFRPIIENTELNLTQTARFIFAKPQIKLTANYTFGNQRVKAKKGKVSDESSRINIGG